MFYMQLNQGKGWDSWPFSFRSFDDAIRDSRTILLNYMAGPIQMRIKHSFDGAVVWAAARA
jgi:hypothetical protein